MYKNNCTEVSSTDSAMPTTNFPYLQLASPYMGMYIQMQSGYDIQSCV